ncbi:antA/AntB antirepressor family protein [Pasteurella skyensis]|uniref:AntA/AntB antirepressor family protein n=2 Tax=Phocoenobacter skyensis TaxID=97481 RepID=A0AAJ6N8E2_9PAST|nr:antA/AntB antirepressor family protein [Pasteurella skyensis]MDP8172103.1 antA/AntB antirepressor family protein [Pasteurella skyensis]MDP8182807.1 antA/AntB antirepressor family protein [Pasteurella skyensis]MDP8188665.1 antA/AntB antirepressor family protein [Pasteurella skyensis]
MMNCLTNTTDLTNPLQAFIPVIKDYHQGVVVQYVNARDLHSFLESKRDFSNWMKERIKQYEFKKGKDYHLLTKKVEQVSGAKTLKEYKITLPMAKELAMVERNKQGKLARQYFIQCEAALSQIAPGTTEELRKQWLIERQATKTAYQRMCEALYKHRQRQGKITNPCHYSNEANLINRIVLDMSPVKWKQANNITDDKDLRSHFNAEQLSKAEYLENANGFLLDDNQSYEVRKAKLKAMLNNRFIGA